MNPRNQDLKYCSHKDSLVDRIWEYHENKPELFWEIGQDHLAPPDDDGQSDYTLHETLKEMDYKTLENFLIALDNENNKTFLYADE